MTGESDVKELWEIPHAHKNVGRKILDTSEDLQNRLINQLKISRFALQVDETADVVKDGHSIAYV
jgi:hypothetical protein